MNEQKFTIKEALQITAGLLGQIELPISMYDKIGAPIRNAISNIEKCINAIPDAIAPEEPTQIEEETT